MKLFLFLCTILIFKHSSADDFNDDDDLEVGYRNLFGFGGQEDTTGPNNQQLSYSPINFNFLSPFNILPRLSCRAWRCRLTFPSFLDMLPRISVEVGIIIKELRIYGIVYKNGQIKYSKSLGLTDFNICIPFTSICFKVTYIKLPWGPICAKFSGHTLPCFKMDGWLPTFFYPNQYQTGRQVGNPNYEGLGSGGYNYGSPYNGGYYGRKQNNGRQYNGGQYNGGQYNGGQYNRGRPNGRQHNGGFLGGLSEDKPYNDSQDYSGLLNGLFSDKPNNEAQDYGGLLGELFGNKPNNEAQGYGGIFGDKPDYGASNYGRVVGRRPNNEAQNDGRGFGGKQGYGGYFVSKPISGAQNNAGFFRGMNNGVPDIN